MTQQGVAPSPTPSTPSSSAAPAPASSSAARSRLTDDVPRLLNRWQAVAVVTCLVFAVLAATVQVLSWQANGRAADNTEQLVRVQQVQSSLLRADALATNAFLVGGLEPVEQRAEYDAAVDDVLRRIADAAEAQPADREALAELSTRVAAYATGIEQARDNNRQGFPIGAQYLGETGASLRSTTLPIVEALIDANAERAVDEMDAQHPSWLFGLGLLALASLFWVNRQLAQRFRRRINVGVAAGGLVVALLTLAGLVHAVGRDGSNDEVRTGSYALAVDEATARTAANNAKARESIRLVQRGSGAVNEPLWDDQAAIVEDTASRDTLVLWEAYAAQHADVAVLDDEGRWDAAVEVATTDGADGTTQALDAFDAASQQVIDDAATEAADDLRSGGVLALLLVVLTLLGGLAAAAAASWGIDQRRKEYS